MPILLFNESIVMYHISNMMTCSILLVKILLYLPLQNLFWFLELIYKFILRCQFFFLFEMKCLKSTFFFFFNRKIKKKKIKELCFCQLQYEKYLTFQNQHFFKFILIITYCHKCFKVYDRTQSFIYWLVVYVSVLVIRYTNCLLFCFY